MGGDANLSPVIDNLAGLRALLNHAIRELYRRKSSDQKFTQDITVKHTIVIADGEGTCPDEIMRPMLNQSNITDSNGALVSYMDYATDASNATFDQLGYTWLVGDVIHYTAPAPDLTDFDGNLYVTVATFPTFPVSMASAITFPSEETVDDVVMTLALALRGEEAMVTN